MLCASSYYQKGDEKKTIFDCHRGKIFKATRRKEENCPKNNDISSYLDY